MNSWQYNISNDFNNSHQQSPKANMRNKCKTQETNLKSKKNGVLQKFPATKLLEKDEDMERKRKREEKRRCKNFDLIFSLIGLYKARKAKSNIFLTLGRNYTIVLPLLTTIQTSPNIFQLFNLVLPSSNSLHQ